MSAPDHSLVRLLKAAAQAPKPAPGPLPFLLEARTLAQWRSAAAEDEFAHLVAIFRWATVCAGLIAVLSVVWSSRENGNGAGNATAGTLALANYEINLRLPP